VDYRVLEDQALVLARCFIDMIWKEYIIPHVTGGVFIVVSFYPGVSIPNIEDEISEAFDEGGNEESGKKNGEENGDEETDDRCATNGDTADMDQGRGICLVIGYNWMVPCDTNVPPDGNPPDDDATGDNPPDGDIVSDLPPDANTADNDAPIGTTLDQLSLRNKDGLYAFSWHQYMLVSEFEIWAKEHLAEIPFSPTGEIASGEPQMDVLDNDPEQTDQVDDSTTTLTTQEK